MTEKTEITLALPHGQESFSGHELISVLSSPEAPIRIPENTFTRIDKSHWTRDEVRELCQTAGYTVVDGAPAA